MALHKKSLAKKPKQTIASPKKVKSDKLSKGGSSMKLSSKALTNKAGKGAKGARSRLAQTSTALNKLIPESKTALGSVKKADSGKKRIKHLKKDKRIDESAVVYLGHIPDGFFEKELQTFFAQFGSLKRVCLKRSQKTGNSKGYAFLQFENPEVARIVAKTMDKYMLFGKILDCKLVPSSEYKAGMLFGQYNKADTPKRRLKVATEQHNRELSAEIAAKRILRRAHRNSRKIRQLEALDIDSQLLKFEAYNVEDVELAGKVLGKEGKVLKKDKATTPAGKKKIKEALIKQ